MDLSYEYHNDCQIKIFYKNFNCKHIPPPKNKEELLKVLTKKVAYVIISKNFNKYKKTNERIFVNAVIIENEIIATNGFKYKLKKGDQFINVNG